MVRPGAVALLSTAFLAGGITQVCLDQAARDAHRSAVLVAQDQELAHQARVDVAAANRMTLQATAFATVRRTEALELAHAAVAAADAAVGTATPVLTAETISPLTSARAELADLIAATGDALATTVTTAGLQAMTAAPEGSPTPGAPAAERVSPPSGTAAPVTTTDAGHPAASVPEPAVAPEDATNGIGIDVPADPMSLRSATASRSAARAPLSEAVLPDASVDLVATAQMVAAAEQVLVMSQEVGTTAAVARAEAEAAARAAAEAEAAARAAAERASRVEEAAAAENGAIPVDVLCGVAFEADVLLRCDAAAALEELNVAFAERFDRDLDVTSSYRDYAAQVATKRARGGLASAPGTSNHGLGLAVDLDGFGSLGQFDLPTYRWMRENAGRFGWHHPSYMQPGGAGPAEPWHWEYGTED